MKVLIVDDDSRFRRVVKRTLQAKGEVEVVGEAGDGEEAIKLCHELHPDIVLMDITMPYLNGLAATRRIKTDMPEAKVIILTVHDEQGYRLAGNACGADAFILKKSLLAELFEEGVLTRLSGGRKPGDGPEGGGSAVS